MINDTLRQKPSQGNRIGLKTRRHPLNFERFASEGNRFIKDVAWELGVTRNSAARITKAVLHAVRDKLPPDDAVEFAQGLPMALKAVYFEQYDLSDTPVRIRRPHDFLDYIFYKNEFTSNVDFPHEDSVVEALKGVFKVLGDYMDSGQVKHLKKIIGKEIVQMIEG
jgi:uncharacterized protein (DUF2267 family)